MGAACPVVVAGGFPNTLAWLVGENMLAVSGADVPVDVPPPKRLLPPNKDPEPEAIGPML